VDDFNLTLVARCEAGSLYSVVWRRRRRRGEAGVGMGQPPPFPSILPLVIIACNVSEKTAKSYTVTPTISHAALYHIQQ